MPLAGHSLTLPLAFPCCLSLSPVCGLSSAGTQLFPAHPEPDTCMCAASGCMCASECVMCQQVRCWNTIIQDNSSLGSLLGPHHHHDNQTDTGCRQIFLYWLHLQGSACSVPQDKGTLVNLPVTETQQKDFLAVSFTCSCLLWHMLSLFVLSILLLCCVALETRGSPAIW